MTSRAPGAADLKMMAAFPRAALRVAKGWLKAMSGQKRPLHGVEFCVTYHCQLNCPHCLTKSLIDESRREMTKDQAQKAIGDLADLGAVFINVTGGEPLMRPDIFDILAEAAKRRDILVTLASNGLAIDGQVARELKKANVAIVVLSLDGADARAHDASRAHAGAFDALMNAARELRRVKIPVWFTTILTKENAEDGSIFQTADLAKSLRGVLTVNWAYAVGKNWSQKNALAGAAERRAFARLMRMPHVRWEGSSNFGAEGCPAGSEKLYVTPYGDVFPCACIQASFGNLIEEPAREIWRRMGRVGEFDGRRKECLVACDAKFIDEPFKAICKNPGLRADEVFTDRVSTDGKSK